MITGISIVVPTLNGAATLPALLDAIEALRPLPEVLFVDSGSTDGTLELLARRGHRVLGVPAGQFNHGATRNLGIAATRGELVVLTVQDAAPRPSWLAALRAPLDADPRVAGSFARQVPRPDASAVTRRCLEGYVGTAPISRVVEIDDPARFEALAPMARYETCVFDNVCACVRRSVWAVHAFPITPIAEDVEWARTVLLAGHRLAYAADAVVEHSHERSARYELMRTYLVHKRLYSLFGLRTIPTLRHLARAVPATLATHTRWQLLEAAPSLRGTARALALGVAFPLGQYLGGKAAASGRELLRPRGV